MRELRQNASRHLARVANGETLEVTDRGRPVARLVPVRGDAWDDMIASGKVSPPGDETDVIEERPGNYDVEASAVLDAMRAEEQ